MLTVTLHSCLRTNSFSFLLSPVCSLKWLSLMMCRLHDIGDCGARHGLLIPGFQVLDRDFSPRDFVPTQNRGVGNLSCRGIFHLLAQLVRLRIDLDADVRLT